jgi:predicted transposase YbfD/YdcC
MDSDAPNTLIEHFSILEDTRDPSRRRHLLIDILIIAITAVLCGADTWTEIEEFGKSNEEWFRKFLKLDNGIPSHDTFGRVFSLLSPAAFQERFSAWIESVREAYEGEEIVAIDGKSLRRSHDRKRGRGPLHMVSAWAVNNRVVLGQRATEAKSNEITAIPELLDTLMLRGCIVTIDAMGCQKAIAEKIVDQGGDYVLALKGNQGTLAEQVEEAFIDADARDYEGVQSDYFETVERGHGRCETRRYWTLAELDGIERKEQWKKLDVVGMVQSIREQDGHTSSEYRYYIASIGNDAQRFAKAVRGHWGVENDLHWSLDISFREDESRIREPQAAENFTVLRHIALARLKNEKTLKRGIKTKRLKAGWDERYRAKLLFDVVS